MSTTNPPPPPPRHHEKTIFKCNQHTTIISEKILKFYQDNELFDTLLIIGTNCLNIHAHKIVLCSLSEYFLELFRTTQQKTVNTTNSNENIIKLSEIESWTMELIIDFMYKGSIELSIKTVKALLRTASILKINTLIYGCCELIEKNINSNNSLNWLQLANELGLPALTNKSLECIYANFKKILKKKELLKLSESELKDLLFINNPHENLGEQVFMSLVAWINYDKPNREHLVIELLSMVHFQALTPKFILKNRSSVCRSVESYELICSWLQWHLLPETRSNELSNSASSSSSSKPKKKPKKKQKKKPHKLGVICMRDSEIIIKTFNPDLNSWSTKVDTQSPTDKKYSSTIVIDNKLILVGGSNFNNYRTNSVECLDLDTSEWIYFPPMNKARRYCQLEDLNGHLCAIGGDLSNLRSLEIYNFASQKWLDLEPLSPLSSTSGIASHNRILYILDLENGFLQTYQVSTNQWTSKESLLNLQYYNRWGYLFTNFGFAATEQYLYIIGGFFVSHDGYDEEHVYDVYRYDLLNNSWMEMAALTKYSACIESIVYKNKIIICDMEEIDEYDLEQDRWNTLGPLSVENCDTCSLTYLK
ncbi:kelch-like protein 1 [Episyrphus balteatus]|uniref:kelch-like protein 1 n=1 Tax=Episyrphus balteatus TaxID=286459 RepID=UPI0024864297|nr:kelch-like protein 1 [Episyrphus balteatus]